MEYEFICSARDLPIAFKEHSFFFALFIFLLAPAHHTAAAAPGFRWSSAATELWQNPSAAAAVSFFLSPIFGFHSELWSWAPPPGPNLDTYTAVRPLTARPPSLPPGWPTSTEPPF